VRALGGHPNGSGLFCTSVKRRGSQILDDRRRRQRRCRSPSARVRPRAAVPELASPAATEQSVLDVCIDG